MTSKRTFTSTTLWKKLCVTTNVCVNELEEPMKEPSSDQLKKLGVDISNAAKELANGTDSYYALGRAAWDACLPIILAETRTAIANEWGSIKEHRADSYEASVDAWFANRLAAMTAKPDPAVEPVRKVIDERAQSIGGSSYSIYLDGEAIARIVAAVDEARKK